MDSSRTAGAVAHMLVLAAYDTGVVAVGGTGRGETSLPLGRVHTTSSSAATQSKREAHR